MAWLKTPEAISKIHKMLFLGRYAYTFDGIPLVATGLSFRRKINMLLAGVDMLFGRTRMLSLPPVIQIEPTNTCNLNCPLCPTGARVSPRAKGFMTMETFMAVLDELADSLVAVYLFCFGEPFLNKDTPEMIKALSDRGIVTLTSTNGHSLQTFDEAMAVVKAGLKTLIIALDGSEQLTYEKYRINGDIEKVKRCASMIEAAKKAAGSPYPYTVIRTVVTKDNEQELPRIEQLAQSLGVNMFSYKTLGCLVSRENFKGFLPGESALRRFGNAKEGPKADGHVKCPFPFRQPVVYWDGTVSGCEYDYGFESPYGKMGQVPFKNFWNSSNALKLRAGVLKKSDLPRFCLQRCSYRSRNQRSSALYCREFRKIGVC